MRYPVEITWPDGTTEKRSIFSNFRGLSRRVGNTIVRPSLRLMFDPDWVQSTIMHAKINAIVKDLFGQRGSIDIVRPGSQSSASGCACDQADALGITLSQYRDLLRQKLYGPALAGDPHVPPLRTFDPSFMLGLLTGCLGCAIMLPAVVWLAFSL